MVLKNKKSYRDMMVGEVQPNKQNQEVLKKLFWKKNKKVREETAEDIINSLETKIKKPRFK